MKKRIGYYCADFVPDTTKSIGILKVTLELLKRLIKAKDLDITLILSERNAMLFKKFDCKKEIIPKKNYPYIINKIFYFPNCAKQIAEQNKLDILFFPKGHLPFKKSNNVKYYSFIHDLIPFYYLKRKYLSFLPICILLWNSMKKSDLIFTNSHYSKSQISKYSKKKIVVVPLGVNLVKPTESSLKKNSFVFVIGNNNPHKNLRLAKKLINKYNQKYGKNYSTFISNGQLSDKELAGYYKNAAFSIFLSDIEGFGLPLIESYAYKTPVVFNDKTSLAEIGKDLKGKCDVNDVQSVFDAIEEVLKMSDEEIMVKQRVLLGRYNWERGMKAILEELQKTT
jgi:hypothetical protein